MSRTTNSNMQKVRGQPCHYCGEVSTTADHVVPRAKGGTNGQWNLVPACTPCNQAKGPRRPDCKCAFCTKALQIWQSQQTWQPQSQQNDYSLPVSEVTKLQAWLNRYLPGQTV